MKHLVSAIVTAAVVGFLAFPATAQTIDLKMQSSDPAGNPVFAIEQEWAKKVTVASGGRLNVEILPVDSVVKYNETHDAVGAGILGGHITSTEYISGKDPAFALLGNTVGAWGSPYEMLRYVNYGGGKELMNELLNPYGLQFLGATSGGLEAFVSKVPIDSVADLRGVKMRAPEGLVQKVFAAAGASPVNLPGSEVFTSLDKGVIDAADYTTFSGNQAAGMNDIATHPIYPGFHSMPLVEISVNKRLWDSMPEDLQNFLEISVNHLALDMTSRIFIKDLEAVAEARAKGITIHDWSQEERAKFRAIAKKQWEEVAGQSANAQRAFDSLTGYLTDQGLLK